MYHLDSPILESIGHALNRSRPWHFQIPGFQAWAMPLCPWRLRRAAQVCLQVDLTTRWSFIACNTATWNKEINDHLAARPAKAGVHILVKASVVPTLGSGWWMRNEHQLPGIGITEIKLRRMPSWFDGNRCLLQIGSGGLVILPTHMISGQDLWRTIRGTF